MQTPPASAFLDVPAGCTASSRAARPTSHPFCDVFVTFQTYSAFKKSESESRSWRPQMCMEENESRCPPRRCAARFGWNVLQRPGRAAFWLRDPSSLCVRWAFSERITKETDAGWISCWNRPSLGTEDPRHPFGRRLSFCPCPWGSLKVHSTGQTAQWLQGPAPPASASLMQERKGVRSLGPLSRPREVARAEAEGGQEASFLSPSSLAGLRAQTGKGPVSAQGARHSTHSHV